MKRNKVDFGIIFEVTLVVANVLVGVLYLFYGDYLLSILYLALALSWVLLISREKSINSLYKIIDLQRQCAQENEKALMSMWNCCVENAWISVDDKLPEPNVYVNIRFANGQYAASYIRKGTGAWAFNLKPTHWKPINKDKA